MSNLCRVTGESFKFVYNIHEGKEGKGGTESLQELTAGAEKVCDIISHTKHFPNGELQSSIYG